MPKASRLVALTLIVIGLGILVLIFLPLTWSTIRFHIFAPPKLIDPTAVSQYPRPQIINSFGVSVVDYSRPLAWFTAPLPLTSQGSPTSNVSSYTLSIPKVGLSNVTIELNSHDLKKAAIHFPGSAIPGLPGNTVILGHSALPQLYKPNSPLTIFNPLLKITPGTEVTINYDGLIYNYVVKKVFEVTPDQVEVLAPTPDHQLTLITCTPLGTYWRRLVVVATLVN